MASMSDEANKIEQLIAQIWKQVEPVVQSEGMELIELEYRREPHGWVLRLFVDQEGPISVEDCAKISRVVGDLLDVSDLITNPYHLEVSSPGLDRPLRKLAHFRKVVGQIIELRTVAPVDKRRKFKGVLMDADTEKITINCVLPHGTGPAALYRIHETMIGES
jgi:ribosome maturation factor RimP